MHYNYMLYIIIHNFYIIIYILSVPKILQLRVLHTRYFQ